MVLLGMHRVVVKDGTIGARLRFRAAAADRAAVQYATSNDPQHRRLDLGRARQRAAAITKVSTVGVNAQSDSELKAELFGEVKINFASETLPLDRFVDEARRTLLERHSRQAARRASRRRLRRRRPFRPASPPASRQLRRSVTAPARSRARRRPPPSAPARSAA